MASDKVIYQTFVNIPEGVHYYLISRYNQGLDEFCDGFAGFIYPVMLQVPSGGASVTFVYNADKKIMSDSINGMMPTAGVPSVSNCEVGPIQIDESTASDLLEYLPVVVGDW